MAEAYEAQLLLFAELCFQRNYLSIAAIEAQFSYELIITAVKDDGLPPRIRAAYYRLLCALWVDRAPQTRMIVPKLVRLWVKVDEDSGQLICSDHCDKFAIAEDIISDHFLKTKGSQYAEERDMNKLTLEVLDGNAPAKAAYEKFGFASYELDPAVGGALCWQKKLG